MAISRQSRSSRRSSRSNDFGSTSLWANALSELIIRHTSASSVPRIVWSIELKMAVSTENRELNFFMASVPERRMRSEDLNSSVWFRTPTFCNTDFYTLRTEHVSILLPARPHPNFSVSMIRRRTISSWFEPSNAVQAIGYDVRITISAQSSDLFRDFGTCSH